MFHNGLFEAKNRQFTNLEVVNMTNDFKTVLGHGGFGTVYHGFIGETQVAVKKLSASSTQGYQQFQAEVYNYAYSVTNADCIHINQRNIFFLHRLNFFLQFIIEI